MDICSNHSDCCFMQGVPARMDCFWVSHRLIAGRGKRQIQTSELLPLISKTAYNFRFYTPQPGAPFWPTWYARKSRLSELTSHRVYSPMPTWKKWSRRRTTGSSSGQESGSD